MHPCHAQPSLPVVPNPNRTTPTQGVLGLHDTAANYKVFATLFIELVLGLFALCLRQ